MRPPESNEPGNQPTDKPQRGKWRLRKDLLSPVEAKEELHRRLTNVLPDLPALVVVIIMGGVGAALGGWWHLNIGEQEFASAVSRLSLLLRICLGCLGSTAAVFLLAKTDTSKLIHCGLIAVLSGMAGPYLVTKALSVVVSVSPELVKIDAAITVVKSSTDQLQTEIQTGTADSNPQKFVDVFDQTAQAAASYLRVIQTAPKTQKDQALAGTKQQFQETFKVLNTAAAVAPKQSLPWIKKLAAEAKDAGASDIAQEAQKIIDTNSAVQAAAQTAAQSGKVYFIAPQDLTDLALHDLEIRIKEKFALADIQPVVHPIRRVENGVEIVYYRADDADTAQQLLTIVTSYLQGRGIAVATPAVRKGVSDQQTPPFQFDIHIGPDIASKLVNKP